MRDIGAEIAVLKTYVKRKKVNKETKTYQLKLIRKLRNKALRLWKERVKERAGGRCEFCGASERIQAAHIECYLLNPFLRFDIRNGASLCERHHKWGRDSFHNSFVFAYIFMVENRMDDLLYLIDAVKKYKDMSKDLITKEYLEGEIKELQR